jgi:hypothetical protein
MFWIDVFEHTAQFGTPNPFEEVGGAPAGEYASTHGDAEDVEYFL